MVGIAIITTNTRENKNKGFFFPGTGYRLREQQRGMWKTRGTVRRAQCFSVASAGFVPQRLRSEYINKPKERTVAAPIIMETKEQLLSMIEKYSVHSRKRKRKILSSIEKREKQQFLEQIGDEESELVRSSTPLPAFQLTYKRYSMVAE